MGTVREDGFEELEPVGYLLGRVDVEGCAVIGGEGSETDAITVEGLAAIDEGSGLWMFCDGRPGCCAGFGQVSGALSGGRDG